MIEHEVLAGAESDKEKARSMEVYASEEFISEHRKQFDLGSVEYEILSNALYHTVFQNYAVMQKKPYLILYNVGLSGYDYARPFFVKKSSVESVL